VKKHELTQQTRKAQTREQDFGGPGYQKEQPFDRDTSSKILLFT
jgi:hypothetical protein